MLEPFSEHKAKNLDQTLLALIESHNTDIETKLAQRQSIFLTRRIIEMAHRTKFLKEIISNQDSLSLDKKIKFLGKTVDNALTSALGLPIEAQIDFWFVPNYELNELSAYDRLIACLTEASEIMSSVGAQPHAKKGPKQQIEKGSYIEFIMQIFEMIKDISLNDIVKLPKQELDNVMHEFYTLLHACSFDKKFTQSEEAFQRYAKRYLSDGRIQYEDVKETYNELMAHFPIK